MKLRTLLIVVGLLAVVSIGVFFVNRPAPPASADARVGQPLADTRALEKATKVRLSDQGKTVTLAKQGDGTWTVVNYHDLPADFSKLSRLVGDLTEAKLQRLVTSNPERLARLEFKDTRIAFLDSADKELWAITLGKNADAGGRYVRFGDEQKGYLANLNAWLDVEPKSWADSKLLDLKSEDVAKVELAFPSENQTITATRAKKEDAFAAENPPEGKKLKDNTVSNLLSSLTNLRFSDTAELNDPKVAAAKAHARTAKLTTFDGKTVTLTLGRKPEEKIVKAPAPNTDPTKSGPAALLEAAKNATAGAEKKDEAKSPEEAAQDGGPAKALEPVTETIPAGPVYVSILHSDPAAPVNALMQKRAFSVSEYTFTSLPQKSEDLFEAAPPSAPPAPAAEAKPADEPKKN